MPLDTKRELRSHCVVGPLEDDNVNGLLNSSSSIESLTRGFCESFSSCFRGASTRKRKENSELFTKLILNAYESNSITT
jgi:hypothetical protein